MFVSEYIDNYLFRVWGHLGWRSKAHAHLQPRALLDQILQVPLTAGVCTLALPIVYESPCPARALAAYSDAHRHGDHEGDLEGA
jgi:hypothetical protein